MKNPDPKNILLRSLIRQISDLSFKSLEEHPILIKLQHGANGANGVNAQNHANRALLLEPAKRLERV